MAFVNINTDLLNGVTNEIGSILNNLAGTAINQISGSLQQQLNGLLGNLTTLLGGLGGKRAVAIPQIQQIQQQIQNVIPQLQSTVNQVLSQVSLVAQNLQTALNTFVSTLTNPQGRSVLLAASQQAKGEIADAFNSLLNEALGHLTSIATTLANVGLASVLSGLQGKRGIFDGFGDIISNLTATLGGHIDNITSSVVSAGSTLLGAVTPHLQDLQDQLTNHALNAAQSLLGTLSNISGSLQG